MTPAILLLGAVTAGRLAELFLARFNTRALMARGAHEAAAGHYPFIVALHAAWLASLWLSGWNQTVHPAWLAVFLALQLLRIWVLTTLGERWTTRIMVLPDAPLVSNGPYRFISHPNYVVVCGEIAVLPLCLGLPWIAVAFSLANMLMLSVRVRAEKMALKSGRGIH